MKRMFACLLVIAFTLSVTACGAPAHTGTTPTTTQQLLDSVDKLVSTTVSGDGSHLTTTLSTEVDSTTTQTAGDDTHRGTTTTATTTTAKEFSGSSQSTTTTAGHVTSQVGLTTTVKTTSSKETRSDNKSTLSSGGKPSTVVTTPSTTTVRPAPVPTVTTTKATKPQGNTTTTTQKKAMYTYVTGQQHTPLPDSERYLYSLLDDEFKGYYRKIHEAVTNLQTSVELNADLGRDNRHHIFFLYLFDNPEQFFLCNTIRAYMYGETDGLFFSYTDGVTTFSTTETGVPLESALRQSIETKRAAFQAEVRRITSTIPASAPAVVKERLLYNYLTSTCSYNLSPPTNGLNDMNWTAYGGLVNKTGVCEAYAEAFQTLCLAVGIPCTGITGKANGGDHKWNAVQLDGEWYQCDVTFDDPIGGLPSMRYHTYFNLTDAQMKQLGHNHENSQWPVPVCTATAYNWEHYVSLYGE